MIAWEDIQTVFMDMDGTLLDLNFDNHFWNEFVPSRFAEKNGLSMEAAKVMLAPRFKAMEGTLEWYCLDYWSEQLKLDIVGMKYEIDGLIGLLPHVGEFLELMRKTGKRLVLATNAHPKSLGLKLEKTSLHVFFDEIISSHRLGYPKESTIFWQKLAIIEPFESEKSLLIDDSLAVLRSARSFGIKHLIAVKRHDSTRASREITEFDGIDDFRELMPGLEIFSGLG